MAIHSILQVAGKVSFLNGSKDERQQINKNLHELDSRRGEQKQAEIIVNTSTALSTYFPDYNNSLYCRQKDSDCELVGLQLLRAENNYIEEDDNWDELSLDYEGDDEYYSRNYNITMPPPPSSLPPILSPTSVMTKKLHPLSKEYLFL